MYTDAQEMMIKGKGSFRSINVGKNAGKRPIRARDEGLRGVGVTVQQEGRRGGDGNGAKESRNAREKTLRSRTETCTRYIKNRSQIVFLMYALRISTAFSTPSIALNLTPQAQDAVIDSLGLI